MLLTRSPLSTSASFDLHVLGIPLALILSQDQTLKIDGFYLVFKELSAYAYKHIKKTCVTQAIYIIYKVLILKH